MLKRLFLVGAMLITCPCMAVAGRLGEIDAGQATVKSGTSSVVRRWWNCKDILPPISSANAGHGTMALHVGSGNHCGKPNQPVLELVYTPPPGFKGQDDGYFYFTRWTYRLSITVE
jgi:hypothetical protein